MAQPQAHETNKISFDRIEALVCQCSEALAQGQNTAPIMEGILAVLGQQLQCDRVFLYVRDPSSAIGRVPFCWKAQSSVPTIYDPQWKPEPSSLADEDPMFAAALNAQPSIFVDDVERADPGTLNREFECKTFGHRALVHAHLCSEQTLWGVLQACTFDRPRDWSQSDRQLIEQAVAWLTPVAMTYVEANYDSLSTVAAQN
ncbi:GAF domain-containing protein [Nodosilinea sp. LEGE 06152]|uniref:GAF domain-containing protein n=1 Tax=Nodosilinea sp. LEGE 06152 TaxID=2777966 RepID=UPI001882BEE9|nr:GAF domain-containing protein [Nodosilinea sp. LEGE 06152]MBE9159364.1 GAF domain-containing protein [Nodosilinea sp. LEGE 06152]